MPMLFFKILEVSTDETYFWIDDLFVTGTLVRKLAHDIKIYNWRNNFMSDHSQYRNEILHGNFFSPELMVSSDITSEDIKVVSQKFAKCHEKNCYEAIYSNPEITEHMKPSMVIKSGYKNDIKYEL